MMMKKSRSSGGDGVGGGAGAGGGGGAFAVGGGSGGVGGVAVGGVGGGYQVGRFTGRCVVSGVVLEPGSSFVVSLVDVWGGEGDGGGLVRVDVSLSAWEAEGEAGAARAAVSARLRALGLDGEDGGVMGGGGGGGDEGVGWGGRVFAVWRARVPMAGEKRRLLADDDVLLEVFDQMTETVGSGGVGAGDGRAESFRFVLALLLVRKKLLVLERTTRDALFVRHRGVAKPPPAGDGPALIEVADPGLSPDDAAALAGALDVVMAEPLAEGDGGGEAGGVDRGGAS